MSPHGDGRPDGRVLFSGALRAQLAETWLVSRRSLILAALLVTAIASALATAVIGGVGDLAALMAPQAARAPMPLPYRPADAVVSAVMTVGHRVFSAVERASLPLGDRIGRLDVLLAGKLQL